MITKFKIFESVNVGKPEVGDYVICEMSADFDGMEEFVNSHIGQISNIQKPAIDSLSFPIAVKFEDFVDKLSNVINFDLEEINYWSKNKSELEHIIAAKKYNL